MDGVYNGEHPIKMDDDWEVGLFQETSICINTNYWTGFAFFCDST